MLDCLTGYISALRSNFHSSLSQIRKFSKQIMADSRNIYILVWQMLSCLYGIQSLQASLGSWIFISQKSSSPMSQVKNEA